MYCINLESFDPFFNLAVEESLLKSSKEEYLILGINNPSVIIGKHQIAHREANTLFVSENQIPVIRRISGGGTVFHDKGNLNFSFIQHSESGRQIDFRKYTKPVIDFLSSLGLDARFEGKNDLKIGGLKISGNAEHIHRNRVLHHGTLLFSTALEMLRNSLRKDTSCYTSRAVESNPSSVVNLKEFLNSFPDINGFRLEMIDYFLKNIPALIPYELTGEEKEKALSLAHSKYRTWEWNVAYGPEYTFNNTFEINKIQHSCRLFVRDGFIRECTFEGSMQMMLASKSIIGCRHQAEDLSEALRKKGIILTENEIYNFF